MVAGYTRLQFVRVPLLRRHLTCCALFDILCLHLGDEYRVFLHVWLSRVDLQALDMHNPGASLLGIFLLCFVCLVH